MTSKPVLAIPAENQQHYEEEVGELVEKVQEKAAAQVDWSGERFGELTGRNKRWLTESDYERLTELNVCHSLVTIGAKVVVAYFQRGEFGRRVEFLPVRSFTDRMNGTDTIHGWIKDNKGKAKQGNPIGLGEAWLAWNRKCRHDDGVIFRPAQEVSETHLNLWQGFAVEPKLGPVGLWLAHLKQVICNGDEHLATYLKKYIAHMVQRPHIKPTVAITLFTDGKGAGKDLFIAPLLTLLGYHGAQINGLDHIVGRFNAMLEGKILISCNEARITSDEKLQKAKTVISERTVAVERKGIDAIPIRQYARLILTTNSETAIKVEKGERRQCMIHCSEEYATRRGDAVQERKRSEYFGPLGDWVDGDGPAHLLHYLLHMVDLEGFDVNDCPATATLNEAILEHLPPQDIWLIDWAANVKAHSSSSKEGLTSIPLGTLRESFNVFMAQYNMPPVTETAWRSKGGKLFTKAGILLSTDAKERKRVIKMTPEAIRKKVADYVSLPPEDVFGVDTP